MTVSFTSTLRSLGADRTRSSSAAIGMTAALFGGWLIWFTFANVTVHEAVDGARIQVLEEAHAVDAPTAGRVVGWSMKLGDEVNAGDVLVQLDAELERRRLDEEKARLEASRPELDAIERELRAEEMARNGDRSVLASAILEGRARKQVEEASSRLATEEAKRASALSDAGAISSLELARARTEEERRRAATAALSFDIGRLRSEHSVREGQALSRIEELRRRMAELDGRMATSKAAIAVLEEQIARLTIRAPVSGKIGEIAAIHVGSYVKEGDRIGAVVPTGSLRAVADFDPPAALGRIRPGQDARLRLDGFPWAQFGSVPARVTSVASEAHLGRIRVELQLLPQPGSRIPLQHGLPGSVEIDVDRATPARLTLRAAGKAFGRPVPTRGGT